MADEWEKIYIKQILIDVKICLISNAVNAKIIICRYYIDSQMAELESEVPVCKSKSLLRIFLARVNSGYSIRRKKVGIYNSKLEVTNPKWNLQNQID